MGCSGYIAQGLDGCGNIQLINRNEQFIEIIEILDDRYKGLAEWIAYNFIIESISVDAPEFNGVKIEFSLGERKYEADLNFQNKENIIDMIKDSFK